MHVAIESKVPEIERLCGRFGGGPRFDYFGNYFGLKEGLEELFGRPVDIVTMSSVKNPYFREQVLQTRETIYAA